MPLEPDGGKYGDIGDPWGNPLAIPEYGGGGAGGGGLTGPFIPTTGFIGGSAPFFGGFPSNPFGGGAMRRIPWRGPAGPATAFSAGGAGRGFTGVAPGTGGTTTTTMMGAGGPMARGGASPAMSIFDVIRGRMPGGGAVAPQAPPSAPAPFDPSTEQFNSVFDIINNLITHGVRGDVPGYGGVFGLNPPPEIMNAIRTQAVGDANAQQRAARLGLQSRGDIDPSTYGFQSLMSDLQGQRGTAQALNQANLGLRQGQLDNYWRLLNSLLGAQQGLEQTNIGARSQERGFDWGSLIPRMGIGL